jgi:hypothetical protein
MTLVYEPELWSKQERLVYTPKAFLLKAQLVFEFEKRDEQSAQLNTVGFVKIPIKGEERRNYTNAVTAGSHETPDVLLMPILLRSQLKNGGPCSLKVRASSKIIQIDLKPSARVGDLVTYEVTVSGNFGRLAETRSGTAKWSLEEGVLTEIHAPMPVVGNITLFLSEHSRS